MPEDGNSAAYAAFYQTSKERLSGKIAAFNRNYAGHPHPLLRRFYEAFADLNAGGKLLRGVFVNLGCALAGEEDPSGSDGLAIAFELFQTAVLIHDDIIDHARLRRGKETVHKRYADRIRERKLTDRAGDTPASAAICVGDLGLYEANRYIADQYKEDPRLGDYLSYFDRIVLDTIEGELLDVILPTEISDPCRGEEETGELLHRSVREIYEKKTAQYSVVGPLHLGMLYGNAAPDLMEKIDAFAKEAGVAFQIRDDILGIFAEEKKLGKDIGSDIAEAKLTILYEYVRIKAPSYLPALSEVYGAAEVTEDVLAQVQRIFRESGALAYAEEETEKAFRKAEEILQETSLSEEKKELLLGLLSYLRGRTF